jgi:hypothetical protein
VARVVRTTKTVRGRRYRSYYVKIDIPERIAERVEAYRVLVDEETGRIVLEPLPRSPGGEIGGEGGALEEGAGGAGQARDARGREEDG